MDSVNAKELWENAKKRTKKSRIISLAPYYSFSIDHDIKHLNFAFSRYKFASKMIGRKKGIGLLELGCNHGLEMKFFEQTGACERIVGVDFDHQAIEWANENVADDVIEFVEDDFLRKDYAYHFPNGGADAIVSIDVIEHIPKDEEDGFLQTIFNSLNKNGVAIIGTPNMAMDAYASHASKIGHVNLFSQDRLYQYLSKLFNNVFIFGMNDEVIHTGFDPMCCYIMAVCTGKRDDFAEQT